VDHNHTGRRLKERYCGSEYADAAVARAMPKTTCAVASYAVIRPVGHIVVPPALMVEADDAPAIGDARCARGTDTGRAGRASPPAAT
jgi:hypothetical protein